MKRYIIALIVVLAINLGYMLLFTNQGNLKGELRCVKQEELQLLEAKSNLSLRYLIIRDSTSPELVQITGDLMNSSRALKYRRVTIAIECWADKKASILEKFELKSIDANEMRRFERKAVSYEDCPLNLVIFEAE